MMSRLHIFLALPLALILYLVSSWIYNIFFHPLRRFPGHPAWKASRLPYALHVFRGDLDKPEVMGQLHEQYGRIVRIAPETLAFADAEAWKDLCGHKPEQRPNIKDLSHFGPTIKGAAKGIMTAEGDQHTRFRKLLAPAFNLRALEDQQPIIMQYIDLLIKGLTEEAGKGPLNIAAWMQWTTFDACPIIGDLTYGESFDGLKTKRYHPWILHIFDTVKMGRLIGFLTFHYPFLQTIMPYIQPKSVAKKRGTYYRLTTHKLRSRMEEGATRRPDFVTLVLRHQSSDNALTFPELLPNAATLILAGSETTGTLLSGAMFLLARNPSVYLKLASEIRSAFADESEIDFTKVNRLPYLEGVLKESLRMYPPVPAGLDRIVTDPAGNIVAGEWLPPGTKASVHQLASYMYSGCFKKPTEFIPERWLGDPEFEDDVRDIVQPFSVGHRDCIGRSLAYIEMRLILARVLYRFDIGLVDKGQDWIAVQKIYGLWEKIPLMVHIRPIDVK